MGSPSNVTKLPTAAKKGTSKKSSSSASEVKGFEQLFKLSKETPGTYVYAACDAKGKDLSDGVKVQTVYVKKQAFKGAPAFLKMTVEALSSLKGAPVADDEED